VAAPPGEVGLLLFICSSVSIARPNSIIPADLTSSSAAFLAAADGGERGGGMPIAKSVLILVGAGAAAAW
jgi:hypothetical protein